MALSTAQLDQQKKQAEELLFSGPETLGFVKGLFFGRVNQRLLFPYPELPSGRQAEVDQALAGVRDFAEQHIDADAIDRMADIPREVIRGLGDLGVLGMTAPLEHGGRGFNQQMYCRVMELIGGHCASTAVFVNAHHSIGVRALLLFGTSQQQQRWLPGLTTGSQLAAFALTEPEAGSDAANVQTRAVPTEDGAAFLLTGEKRYITNAALADVLTVMARTPAPTEKDPSATKITAFLVTPDMPGFEVLEARADKCGIRGTATGRLRFTNMRVPRENILGPIGKGLKVALTVLDFGRTTFGATCTGVAKRCVQAAAAHAAERVQFQQPLAEFELVKKKLAFMAAHSVAMEAMTTQCAAFIDRGADDYMLETAILKVFATEHLWTIINDTIQIFGGKAYFKDQPYERMMRDARINLIGEGANDVLKAFIAVVGCRGPGEELAKIREGLRSKPLRTLPKAWAVAWDRFHAFLTTPVPSVKHPDLRSFARRFGKRVKSFAFALPWAFLRCGDEATFLQSQYLHERIADIAMDLYASACVLSKLDTLCERAERLNGSVPGELHAEIAAGKYFLRLAEERIGRNLANLHHPLDPHTTATANVLLASLR